MDSTPEVNVAENGNSTEKELKNDEVTSTVTLAPNKESTSETESPAIETEQNESLDKIESTEKQVEEKSSITDASTDTIEKEIDSTEAVTDSDAKTTDPTFEELPVTDNPILIDSALKIEDDKPKVPIDVEEQDVNIEDTESGDDAEESFSEDEDPNEPATVSTESPAENHSKNETATQNESLNEKEKKDLVGKGEEGFSSDKVKSDSVQSELSLNKPTETEVKKPEEHIPVQTEFSETQTNEGVKPSDQKDFNNQIKEIISDIDINIKAQEKITQLKEQELKLIQKQNELANQIHEQQLLAQQLCDQNKLKQQQIQLEAEKKTEFDSQRFQQNGQPFQPITTQFQEPAHISKTNVDLRKIFTPATDTPEILPKNRKLYASSAFYSPTLHPTVEDQVELARRISHSLSDISNQTSKGQSMYVNRKKRSVKWVHEGGQDNCETNSPSLFEATTKLEKMPLKLVMNPKGQVRDYNSLKELINVETGLLSPDNCAELITALQLHQGRGAELFAKRRKKADNWIVDETNAGTQSLPSGIPDYQQYQPRQKTISPNILPAYSDAGKHRVQLNLHQNQLIEKYSKGGVQVVKSPWEAALQTGSASSAFLEESPDQVRCPSVSSPMMYHRQSVPRDLPDATVKPSYDIGLTNNQQQHREEPYRNKSTAPIPSNPQRVLAYTPSVAQGWGGRSVELPKEYCESNEVNVLPCQSCDFCRTRYDRENMDFLYAKGEGLSATFTNDIEKRLNRLEQIQMFFLEQQHQQLAGNLSKKNIEIDDKLNVRELIHSFEQQSLGETSKNSSNDEDAINKNEGLYVPKEISLSSYVPPPQKQPSFTLSQKDESTFRHMPKSNFGVSADTQFSNGRFPLSNSNPLGYTTSVPKEQHSFSSQPINNIAPQVNFNPSPLSFDKLSRYENNHDNQNQQQHLNVRQKTQVQNASPIPFGTSKCTSFNENLPRSPISWTSPIEGASPQPYNLNNASSHRQSNQGQSFNKLARGWGEVQSKQHQQTYSCQYIPPATVSRNLPYTEVPYSDF
ncbi:protein P200 isoform X3 [Drosophila kikkawai]|uniref:Protein P200 isoform X3 n=1 Tax=Drosophila kikkawai TaxID=30033 RepID=A0ABM3C7B9_DROKI|nr:uncharacterized protein LOC108072466 isoform X1 [Drosophila kikkawai]XP_041632513.1 uncharacterized protein LOC108072466 isoform X1 [Drosophila kikkawai]XP_041632514.1 uncharacterized protein LOC108072466 isoform X1 [Drosophila kikkawai]